MGDGCRRLGLLVKQAREEKGWTQQELADEMDVDVRTVQRLEEGLVNPTLTAVAGYFFLLNISPNVATYEDSVEDALKMDHIYRELQELSEEQFARLWESACHIRKWRGNHPEIVTLEDYRRVMREGKGD